MGDEGLANGKGDVDVRENSGAVNGKGHVGARESGGALNEQSKSNFKLGDMTWIKLRGASWWPAQIVDANAISDNLKPRKGKSGHVLVRLYGTYEYTYMNPVTSLLEFNNVLKESKSSQRQFFMKMLEQDLSKLQSKRTNARKTKPKGNGCVDMMNITPSKRATEEQVGIKKKCKQGDEDTLENSEVSARRLKVMLDLGLKAPSGSPFRKNGQFLSIVQ